MIVNCIYHLVTDKYKSSFSNINKEELFKSVK